MKITFLGSGSSFISHKHNYQNNILIEVGNKKILVDAGTTILPALEDAGHDPKSITDIIITHCHGDHIYGLEALGFINYFSKDGNKPFLHSSTAILNEIVQVLSPSMSTLESGKVSMTKYFKFRPFDGLFFFYFESSLFPIIKFVPVQHVKDKESYGISIAYKNMKIFFTSDTKFHYYDQYNISDIIFQDCEFADYPNGVHAQYRLLRTLPENIKSKMWLMHCNIPITDELQIEATMTDGFKGVATRGQIIDLKELRR